MTPGFFSIHIKMALGLLLNGDTVIPHSLEIHKMIYLNKLLQNTTWKTKLKQDSIFT